MSFASPKYHIPRQSVLGEENEFVKMFDPRPVGANLPGDAPLPEPLTPTNPVPEVMGALGVADPTPSPARSHQHQLLSGLDIVKWDAATLPPGADPNLHFFTISDAIIKAPFNGGQYPAPTTRVPRGVIFHSVMQGKGPPPHTIHWHGIEPTPVNDGVGHCSMELGRTTYQWQPNFIGTYFYHCHRNTMQHFEFGLFGLLLIEPPDAYFASVVGSNFQAQTIPALPITLNGIPVGACSDGRFRTAANVKDYNKSVPSNKRFNGYVEGDPTQGVANGDPHAFTVPYDVEALWVLDDRDSVWSTQAQSAFQTFPQHGDTPGINDNFAGNVDVLNPFFAFNDFNADYWFITGVPVPAARLDKGGTGVGTIPAGVTIPAALNSGKSGSQVSISATRGQTILVRCLDSAYNSTRVTFPMDVLIIAWDGRALGVPPFGLYNRAFLVPANTPIRHSTARRYDALIRPTTAGTFFAKVEFLDTRGGNLLMTANIPIVIV
jgi:hypothetical protein